MAKQYELVQGDDIPFEDIMIKVAVSDLQASEARLLSKERKVPFGMPFMQLSQGTVMLFLFQETGISAY